MVHGDLYRICFIQKGDGERMNTINKTWVALMMIVVFILIVVYVSIKAEKIGFYKACDKMGLDVLTYNGELECGKLDELKRYNGNDTMVIPDFAGAGIVS